LATGRFSIETEMVYLAFIFALALACLAVLEFIFLMSMETRNRQLQKRLKMLEKEHASLQEKLRQAEAPGEQQPSDVEEIWPELIDDNSLR
jgi:uncharacterized membrane protein YciS (DUF1049 family)